MYTHFPSDIFFGKNVKPTPMTALVGHSIHRVGCIFHLPLYPNQHSTTINVFWLLTFDLFFVWLMFPNPNLHITLPPNYPTNLHLNPTYELTTNP